VTGAAVVTGGEASSEPPPPPATKPKIAPRMPSGEKTKKKNRATFRFVLVFSRVLTKR